MIKLKILFICLVAPLFLSQCKTEHPVPEVYVNFIIELNNPYFFDLNAVGNSQFISNEGYRGIIVTRTEFSKFVAYEATCTHDPDDSNAIIEIEGISGVCKNCGSKFSLLLDGLVEEGPAGLPLKTYVAEYNQVTNSLLIHN